MTTVEKPTPHQELDWNGRPIQVARSKGGVLAVANFDDQLLKTVGMPWPPAPVVQKLYKSRQESAFDDEARRLLTKRLGHYCDLQSVHSEDALTWNYFGPFLAAPPAERVRFANWLLSRLDPGAELNRTCEIDLWRRIPHPDTLVPGGPEIDFLVAGDRCVILGEAKWLATEGKGQGLLGNKTQLQLRAEFLDKYGSHVYGDRSFHVVFVTLSPVEAQGSHGPRVAQLTWDELCGYAEHPLHAEINRYYQWKRKHSRQPHGAETTVEAR